MKTTGLTSILIFLAFLVCQAGQLPAGFIEEELATKLNPTDLAISSDGQIYIAQKNGTILLWRDGKVLTTPFMELEVEQTNERGLQGIELDPDFDNNGYFYIYYSQPNNYVNRVSRFTAVGDRALPSSEVVLYEMDATLASIHNGGGMTFMPDGSLIFAVGDGGATWRSQWDNQTHGKVIRIWPDGSIPDDNPKKYAGGKYDALVGKGMRNPFNIAVNDTGLVYINDVGGDKFEEINRLDFGANYGWPMLEGYQTNQNLPDDYLDPIHAYDHNTGCAIVGGVFCPMDNMHFPEKYRGMYFFSDYCKGYIKVLDPATGDIIETFATEIDRPLRLVFDDNGYLYYFERAGLGGGTVDDNTSSATGRMLRITFTGNGIPVISRDPIDQLVSQGESARFFIDANGSRPLSYAWYLNGTMVSGADSNVLIIPNTTLGQDGSRVFCRVFNQEGSDTSHMAILSVTDNMRPEPMITLESANLYSAGESIVVNGSATDNEDGSLQAEDFVWWIDFHHDQHTHPAMNATADLDRIIYDVPMVGEIDDNVWYRIYLLATDKGGLSQLTHLDVYPKKINITVQSSPSTLELNIDGSTNITPFDVASVAGIEHTLVPNTFQTDDSNAYVFNNWEDIYKSRSYIFDSNEDITITANFDQYALGKGTGLFGEYYNFSDKQPVFDGEPAFSRVDSIVDFEWEDSPNDSLLNQDSFLISWTGYIQPIYSTKYAFGLDFRNGARFYLDGNLLFENWEVNPNIFHVTDSVFLEGGKTYPVRFEVYKQGGSAIAGLYWATADMTMRQIPTSQLYESDPSNTFGPEIDGVNIYPNPVTDLLNIEFNTTGAHDIHVDIYSISGQKITEGDFEVYKRGRSVEVDVANLTQGYYMVQVLSGEKKIISGKFLKL